MTLSKGPRNIKIAVPRHNAQTIGAKLDVEIKKQAKTQHIRTDTTQPSGELVGAIESASEWNSMLMTARAERGPQWDIGTQQFLVEQGSDLYYDSTPLFEAVRKVTEEERGPQLQGPSLQQQQQQQQIHHQQQQPQHHPSQYHSRNQPPQGREYAGPPQMAGHGMDHRHPGGPGNFGYQGGPPPGMGMRGPPGSGQFNPGGGGPGGGGPPFNPMAQQQFYGGNPAPSPMRMGTMGGMTMESQGLAGPPGMGVMGMSGVGGSPAQMGRRMTRTMTDEFSMS